MKRLAFFISLTLLAALPAFAERTGPIAVAAYNLENYLQRERRVDGQWVKGEAKPAKAVAAIIRIIREIDPDILGICEIGPPEQLEDLRARLQKVGITFPHAEFLAGPDAERHLALLSKFPIESRQSQGELTFQLKGSRQKVRRGFLDVTVRVSEAYRLRLIGVHLKSRLPSPDGEDELRRHEARLLRKHVDEVLEAEPDANLLVYGDFNDTKNQPVIRDVVGPTGSPAALTDIPLADEHGDRWTHHWPVADLYSRIDFMFASRGLLPEVVRAKSRVHRTENWHHASDHRPTVLVIQPVEKKR